MLKTPIARGVALATLGATLAIPTMAQADFINDSKAGLELRNFYFNNDFREGSGQSKQEEWAQGFLLRYESGFTEGTVGLGVDAMGLLGIKLDGGDGTAGTGLLSPDRSGGSQNEYSHITYAAKARISKSTLKVGDLQLKNMAIASSDSRLLPQTFQGGQITSLEVDGLTLDAGYLNRVNNRNSTDNEVMTLSNRGTLSPLTGVSNNASGIISTGGAANETDDFRYLGGSYKVMDNLTASYYYSKLEDMYKQHSFNLVHVLPLGDKQSLKTDVRYARSKNDGNTNVDNKAYGAMATYSLSGHSVGLGYQQMNGDTGFAYVGGTDPFLVNYVQVGHFGNRDEKSWQARYDFNFASIGVPGLTFMTRYITGDNINMGSGQSDGKEWERNTDIAYVLQDGALKNLGVRWRNATMRNNFGRDIDQNRLIVSYTLPLL